MSAGCQWNVGNLWCLAQNSTSNSVIWTNLTSGPDQTNWFVFLVCENTSKGFWGKAWIAAWLTPGHPDDGGTRGRFGDKQASLESAQVSEWGNPLSQSCPGRPSRAWARWAMLSAWAGQQSMKECFYQLCLAARQEQTNNRWRSGGISSGERASFPWTGEHMWAICWEDTGLC